MLRAASIISLVFFLLWPLACNKAKQKQFATQEKNGTIPEKGKAVTAPAKVANLVPAKFSLFEDISAAFPQAYVRNHLPASPLESLMLAASLHESAHLIDDNHLAQRMLAASDLLTVAYQKEMTGLSIQHSPLILGQLSAFKEAHLLFGKVATPDLAMGKLIAMIQEDFDPQIKTEELEHGFYGLEFQDAKGLVTLDTLGASIFLYAMKSRKWLLKDQQNVLTIKMVTNIISKLVLLLGYYKDEKGHSLGGLAFAADSGQQILIDPEKYLENPQKVYFYHAYQFESAQRFKVVEQSVRLRDYLMILLGVAEFYKLTHPQNNYIKPIFTKSVKQTGLFPIEVHQLAIGVLAVVLSNLAETFLDIEKRVLYATSDHKTQANIISLSLFLDLLARVHECLRIFPLDAQIFPPKVIAQVAKVKEQIDLLTFFVVTKVNGDFLSKPAYQKQVQTSFAHAYSIYGLFKLHLQITSPFLQKKAIQQFQLLLIKFWNPDLFLLNSHLPPQDGAIRYSPFEAAGIVWLSGWFNRYANINEIDKEKNRVGVFNLLFGLGIVPTSENLARRVELIKNQLDKKKGK